MKQFSAGWYAANFDKVATLAEEATWQSQNPAALFVLSRILRLVETQWNIDLQGEQAFATQEAAEVIESYVQPAITAFLDTADTRELSRR